MEDISQADEAFTQANPLSQATNLEDTEAIYEVGFHLMPSIQEGDVAGMHDTIRQHILTRNAKLLSEGAAQRMTLAYPIVRSVSGKRETFTESYFGWIKFSSEKEVAEALKEILRGMRDIIRFIIIKTIPDDVAPTKRRAIFVSDRLEGEVIQKPLQVTEKAENVSEEELDKSIEAITA